MEQVIVKTEETSSGDILLFFVDENGDPEEGVLTTVDNSSFPLEENTSYVIEENIAPTSENFPHSNDCTQYIDRWTDDETQKLLTFYNDNKEVFLSGPSKRKHLWAMVCKTLLMNKTPLSCDMKFRNMKAKYVDTCKTRKQSVNNDPLFDLCEKAFSDDPYVKAITETDNSQQLIKFPMTNQQNTGVFLKKYNTGKIDEKVDMMLRLYLKYKKNFQKQYFTRNLWETIAVEMGEEDGQYWQKRFLNFKQHYICLLEKKKEGCIDINWPYMALYDEIFKDDEEFRRKYSITPVATISRIPDARTTENDWLETEKIALLKYHYDCFDDFHDPNIPNSFLWTEIGRLLDKSPDICKKKYTELKDAHYEKYVESAYDLRKRKPLDILCDSVIAKDVELQIYKADSGDCEMLKTEETDEIVQFLYDNIEMFKDRVCHFVCWSIIAKRLKINVAVCRRQWEELVKLYKSILDDKKENPDMQIDWRYIEIFDRIFDYGMDTHLLNGYEKLGQSSESDKINVNKVNSSMNKHKIENGMDEDESYDETSAAKRSRRSTGDSKAFKILEYYQKNKDKFSTTNRNKHNLWAPLSRHIGISETQCAHRFRNLKQVYTAYVQREINKPEMPIVWPYYALCKKVFGYRALKNKLKNSKNDSDYEEWSASDIKKLIQHFAGNFDYITNNIEDVSKWAPLASNIDKNEVSCKEKFLELRKSYRKLKTQITRNPNVKISWKYFNMFEQIYNENENDRTNMEVDERHQSDDQQQDDEDFQCIIVIPDGADISDIDNSQIIIQENSNTTIEPKQTNPNKWTKRSKKRLLIYYINYVKRHKSQEIIRKDMWREIAERLNKTALSCRRMFVKLKKTYKESENDLHKTETPYNKLLERVLKLKPKFAKPDPNLSLQEEKVFENVHLPIDKVEKALQYYLQHIEDFVNPKFEKKFLWTELANYISEPVTKVFNKINYLKQVYNSEQLDKDHEQIIDLLKEIIAKEIAINLVTDIETVSIQNYPEGDWSDEEVERLLEWYLGNLDKFKNPKFVRSYLWMEISKLLNRSPLDCSKKMSEIRTQYRNMVREVSGELETWRFFVLCQKIYGTGKKGNVEKIE